MIPDEARGHCNSQDCQELDRYGWCRCACTECKKEDAFRAAMWEASYEEYEIQNEGPGEP